MAQFIMLPSGTTGTNEWHESAIGQGYETLVQSDDGGTSYIYEQASAYQEITFDTANPPVAEADIDFDEQITVQAHMKADYTFVGLGADVGAPHTFSHLNISLTGSGFSLGTASETITTEDASYLLYSGLSAAGPTLISDWSYAALENCQIKLENTSRPRRFHSLRVTYAYITVDYTEVAAADNATFFGANF